MKKIMIGFIAGAVFMMSAQAFGSGISFVGKKVDGQTPVTLNGEKIGEAIIIGGKSFAPVRELTNEFGGKVDSANSGGIALSSSVDNEQTVDNNTAQIAELQNKISAKQADIELMNQKLSDLQKKIDDRKAQDISADVQVIEYTTMEQELENQKNKLADLETQLAELQK